MSQHKGPDENDRWRVGSLPDDEEADCDPVEPPPGPVADVAELLEYYGDSSRPKPTLLNVVTVLERDPRWTGRIRYNSFASQAELERAPVAPESSAPFSDHLDGEAALWLADQYRLAAPTTRVAEALNLVARRHAHHPVRDYLDGLAWDGEMRVGKMLHACFGAKDTPLAGKIGTAFLISCVARVRRPGCKVDTTPILAGPQGIYKSTALRILAVRPEWYADTAIDLGNKDLFEVIQGRWIYELAELDSFKGREWSRIKSMLSSPRDTWRSPYARRSAQVDRQVVFAGTTNEDVFLGDPTGSRRFWPLRVDGIDTEALLRDRDQLWAEASALYAQGARWWLEEQDARAMSVNADEFRIVDPWEPLILGHLGGALTAVAHVSTSELLEHAIKKESATWTPHDQQRVSAIMRRLGWRQVRPRGEDETKVSRGRVWEAPP
jgi:putative DNA primase/helicase